MTTPTPFGALTLSVRAGKSVLLKDDKSYLVRAQLTKGLSNGGVLRTAKAPGNALGWNSTPEQHTLLRQVNKDDKMMLELLESSRLFPIDDSMGTGLLSLGDLLEGKVSLDSVAVSIKNSKQEEVATITVTVCWKDGAVPEYAVGSGFTGNRTMQREASGAVLAALGLPNTSSALVEKPVELPPCEGKDFAIRVRVHKACNLQSKKDANKLYDPLVVVKVLGQQHSTDYEEGTNNPIFDEELVFEFNSVSPQFWSTPIEIAVMDHHVAIPNSRIGSCQIECSTIYRSNVRHFMERQWLVLHRNTLDGNAMGFVQVSLCVLDMRNDAMPDPTPEVDDGSDEMITNNLISGPGCRFEEISLRCDVIRAEGIPVMDVSFNPLVDAKADPYVKFTFGTRKVRTNTIENTLEPVWNTAVVLPVLLPSLTNTLFISMWDHDTLSADDLVGQIQLDFDDLILCGKSGLPELSMRWLNFYGSPRDSDADFNSYFKNMLRGNSMGLDYRGRLLLGLAGTRSAADPKGQIPPSRRPYVEATIKFTAKVQVLELNMLPKGSYKCVVSCGTISAATHHIDSVQMNKPSDLHTCFFGNELVFSGSFGVVLPTQAGDASVAEQVPDLILHVFEGRRTVPFAALRFTAAKALAATEGQYVCKTMTIFTDPKKVDEGEQPTEPLVQAYFGLFITECISPNSEARAAVQCRQTIVMPPILASNTTEFILECAVHQARKLPASEESGLSDPFVRISWGNGSAQTGTKQQTLNPMWNELLLVRSTPRGTFGDIVVEVWDWEFFGSNKFLCKKVIPIGDATDDATAGVRRWYGGWTNSQGQPAPECELLLSFETAKLVNDQVKQRYLNTPRQNFLKKVGATDTYEGYALPPNKTIKMAPYKLSLSMVGLRQMRPVRWASIKAPSVEVEVAGCMVDITKVYGSNPDFNKEFDIYCELPEDVAYLPFLNFRVFDNGLGPRTTVGVGSLAIDAERFNPQKKIEAQVAKDRAVAARLTKINQMKGVSEALTTQSNGVTSADRVGGHKAILKAGALMVGAAALKTKRASLGGEDQDCPLLESEPGSTSPSPRAFESDADSREEPRLSPTSVPVLRTGTAQPRALMGVHGRSETTASSALGMTVGDLHREEKDRIRALELKEAEEEAVERLWFDRFEPEGLGVPPEETVTRLGKVTGVFTQQNATTAEDFFGPFDDENLTLDLRRGWGKRSGRAGSLLYNLSVVKATPEDVARHGVFRVSTPGKDSAPQPTVPQRTIRARDGVTYLLHVYVLSCSNLMPMDEGFLGGSSDPYLVMSLRNGSTKKDALTLDLRKDAKHQTLNPEFFCVHEMTGELPKLDTLRVAVYDKDVITTDELIGFTEINLEQRWHSRRGYKAKPKSLQQGSYTERRLLHDKDGRIQGTIELWVDMFDLRAGAVPRPIGITPPAPIPLELRCIVWNTRDITLQETSINGEDMTDIYVRCWLDGMRHDTQQTDVHYRSLDGTGVFNWRMNFPFVLEPRTRRIMPSTGDRSLLSNFFHVSKEQKKFEPVLHVQVWDNDLLPGTDDFIGEVNIKLLRLQPCSTRRDAKSLVGEIRSDVASCFCCRCCQPEPDHEQSLREKQEAAAEEARRDREALDFKVRTQAKKQVVEYVKSQEAKGRILSSDETQRLENILYRDLMRDSCINVFREFLPKPRKKADPNPAPAQRDCDNTANEDRSGKPKELESGSGMMATSDLPVLTETPKFWFPFRGPNGGNRVGDVQMSFQLVLTDAIPNDPKLQAGRGRSEPNRLPEPDRPASSFFWLSSPFKSAVHILWKNYKWYIVTVVCLVLLAVLVYLFFAEGVETKAQEFFSTGKLSEVTPSNAPSVVVNVVVSNGTTVKP